MLEDAVPSLWAAVKSWFTPTVLFVLLNLVIGTIVVTSKGIRRVHAHPKDEDGHQPNHHFPRLDDQQSALFRYPSSVLERLKSIGSLCRHRSGEIPSETVAAPAPAPATPMLVSHRESDAEGTFETLDEAYKAAAAAPPPEHHFWRSQSDSQPTAGEMPVKLPAKLKKSASAKSAFDHFEENEEEVAAAVTAQRPATTRPSHPTDEEVDAKADDFINRFRQQLKLQRLDSIMRYKEMLTRSGK
uniref:4-chlorobenzoate--CoA ligase n=1 Tax=Anthurium amnicola TaxID=1678845 RepID=A0A1D1XNQ5_9ARAE